MIEQSVLLHGQPSGVSLTWNGYEQTHAGDVHTFSVANDDGADLGEIAVHAKRRSPGDVARVVFTTCNPPSFAKPEVEMAASRLLERAHALMVRFKRQTERRAVVLNQIECLKRTIVENQRELEKLEDDAVALAVPSFEEW